MRNHSHFVGSVLMLMAMLLPQGKIVSVPTAMAHKGRQVELALNAASGSQAAHNSFAGHVQLDTTALELDDGSVEDDIGVTQDSLAAQFIWLNRFTPDPSEFPLTLQQIQVLFDATASSGMSPGDAIDLVVYQDADSNPRNGAILLATYHKAAQATDGITWSVYGLDPPLVLNGPGDVLLGVINRFVTTGVSPVVYPAAVDEDSIQARSWIGWWIADPPDPAILPPDDTLDIIDSFGFPGSLMIRGYGVTGAPESWSLYLPLVASNAGPPSSPVLNDISNPDGDGSYTVSWGAANGATSYTLEEDDNAAFSSPTAVYSGAGTSKSIAGKGIGTYYYRVKAVNTFGSSNWSQVKSVRVSVPPPACPQTGAWSGSTSHGDAVSFTVTTTPSCRLAPFTITMFTWCSGWPSYRYVTVSWNNLSISNNHFSTGSGMEEIVGDFTSRTTATGTWDYFDFSCSGSGTWTASYSP